MNRRLLLSYVGLVLFVLVVLEVPLAVYYSRNERNVLADKVERDAVARVGCRGRVRAAA